MPKLADLITCSLVVSLGIILAATFIKPWYNNIVIDSIGLDAYEPVTGIRIFEAVCGFLILCFGISRFITLLKEKHDN